MLPRAAKQQQQPEAHHREKEPRQGSRGQASRTVVDRALESQRAASRRYCIFTRGGVGWGGDVVAAPNACPPRWRGGGRLSSRAAARCASLFPIPLFFRPPVVYSIGGLWGFFPPVRKSQDSRIGPIPPAVVDTYGSRVCFGRWQQTLNGEEPGGGGYRSGDPKSTPCRLPAARLVHPWTLSYHTTFLVCCASCRVCPPSLPPASSDCTCRATSFPAVFDARCRPPGFVRCRPGAVHGTGLSEKGVSGRVASATRSGPLRHRPSQHFTFRSRLLSSKLVGPTEWRPRRRPTLFAVRLNQHLVASSRSTAFVEGSRLVPVTRWTVHCTLAQHLHVARVPRPGDTQRRGPWTVFALRLPSTPVPNVVW